MSISQRTTKLILATCLACLLAYFLNLSSAVSAGIIALLSLSDTRRSTLKTGSQSTLFHAPSSVYWGFGFSLERISYLEPWPLSCSIRSSSLQDGLGNWYHTKHCLVSHSLGTRVNLSRSSSQLNFFSLLSVQDLPYWSISTCLHEKRKFSTTTRWWKKS